MVGIREAALSTGLTAHTLRYYERIGLVIDVSRDDRGQRLYTEADLRWLVFLTKLRLTGMPIQQMLEYASLMREGTHTLAARQALLEAHRTRVVEQIESLQANLGVIDRKIELYRSGALT